MSTPADRLKWARERTKKWANPTDAARAHGWKVSTYLGHENGDRNPRRAKAKQYAKAYGVRWEWLLEGDGSPLPKGPPKVPVFGYVGAGAEIIPFEHDQVTPTDEVERPPGAPAETIAVIVRGNSMYPRYFDGEHLFYTRNDQPPEEMIGRECVVKLRDGRMLVKILRKGSKRGLFNLESWNWPLLEDQAVEWAAVVRWRG